MIMLSPWKTAALAALLSSVATGQQLVFIPLSAPLSISPPAVGAAGEPPCRARRLAPFRQAVREECRAVPGCVGPADPHSLASSVVVSPATSLEKEMEAFFADRFAPRFSLLGQVEDEGGEEDLFDTLFDTMLGASLRAYDRKALEIPIATVGVEDGEKVVGAEKEGEEDEEQAEGDAEVGKAEDSYASGSADYLEAAATPEEAAENALDVMVASLARSGALAAKEKENEGEVAAEWLPEVLSRLGNVVEAHSRRRLSEAGPGARPDPHARVGERLVRRLTEYSSEMFLSPDGTVTLYTTSHTPLSSFQSSSSFSSFPSSPFGMPPSSSFLGTGSRRADECLRSGFDNGDLEEGCNRAVAEFLLAAEPSPGRLVRVDGETDRAVPFDRFLYGRDVDVAPSAYGFATGHALALFFLFMGCAVLKGACFHQEEEEEEDSEDDEVDYAALPEDKAEEEAMDFVHFSEPCQGFYGAGTSAKCVFVGVPVQVV